MPGTERCRTRDEVLFMYVKRYFPVLWILSLQFDFDHLIVRMYKNSLYRSSTLRCNIREWLRTVLKHAVMRLSSSSVIERYCQYILYDLLWFIRIVHFLEEVCINVIARRLKSKLICSAYDQYEVPILYIGAILVYKICECDIQAKEISCRAYDTSRTKRFEVPFMFHSITYLSLC